MGARQELNVAAFNGCLVIPAALSLVGRSWAAFLVAPAVLMVGVVATGAIRIGRRRRSSI